MPFNMLSLIFSPFTKFSLGLENLKLKVGEIKFSWGIVFKIKEFLIFDWRSNIKLNFSILLLLILLRTINVCHHLKPKYLIFKSKVFIWQLKSFKDEIKWFSCAER